MAKKKILIVEDDKDVVHGMNIRLRANNYDTVVAYDASAAVSVAKKESPDLILLDLGLPAGDGYLVMRRLQAQPTLCSIPVVVVTARAGTQHRDEAIRAGATYFLEKPVDNDDLLATISTVLSKPLTVKVTLCDITSSPFLPVLFSSSLP